MWILQIQSINSEIEQLSTKNAANAEYRTI